MHLNLANTKENEMKGLIQLTLSQIQSYLKVSRVSTLGEGVNNTTEPKDKIKANMYHPNIKDDEGFYFGYETDVYGVVFRCIMWTIHIPQINRDTLY